MSAVAGAATALVVTLKVAELAAAGTRTLAGVVATVASVLDSETAAPPVGAGPVSVTVAVDVPTPATLAGLTARPARAGGLTVSAAVLVAPA
jgi:hypothetical protein